jgi:hypothetical protein
MYRSHDDQYTMHTAIIIIIKHRQHNELSSFKGYHTQSSTYLPTVPTYLPTFVASPSSLHHPYDQMPYHNCRFIHTNDAKRRHINIPLLTGFSLRRGLHVADGIHSLHWRLLEGGIADGYMYACL